MAKGFSNTGVTSGLATDRTGMVGMVAGQYFYETDTNKIWVYDGSSWLNTQDLTNSVNGFLPSGYKAGPRVANITVPRGTSVSTSSASTTPIYWSNLGSLSVAAVANDIIVLTTWLWWDGFDYFCQMYPCTLNASNVAINYLTTTTSAQVQDPALTTVQYTHKQSTISYKVKAGDLVSGSVKVGYYHNRNSGAGAYQLLGASGQTTATVLTLTNLGQ